MFRKSVLKSTTGLNNFFSRVRLLPNAGIDLLTTKNSNILNIAFAGEETPKYKGRGCTSEVLKRTPKRYLDPVLWLEFFLLRTGTNSKTTDYLLSYFLSSLPLIQPKLPLGTI